MVNSFLKKRWILGLFILAGVACLGGAVYYFLISDCNLCDYNSTTDRVEFLKLFENNKYWLTTNENYNVAHMLDTKSPNDYQAEYFGKLTIKAARVHGKPVGFVAYYKKKFYEGFILFLAVDEQYRGKSYATKLLRYAIDALFNDNAQVVRLVTRTNNYAAMKVYERAGMHESERTNGFVYFEIKA
ncbi:MAG: GNAT family N-acetyltransferase [Candidatus Babeliales bacterium]